MFGLVCATTFVAWLAWIIVSAVLGLRRNMQAARESGLQWFVARKSQLLFLCVCSQTLYELWATGWIYYKNLVVGSSFSSARWLVFKVPLFSSWDTCHCFKHTLK